MRVSGKQRLIDLLEDRPHHFLDQLVFRGRHAKWPFLAIGFRDIHPSCRLRSIGPVRKPFDDGPDLVGREAVECLTINSGRHRPFIRGDPLVGMLPEERAFQQAIEAIDLPTRPDDGRE